MDDRTHTPDADRTTDTPSAKTRARQLADQATEQAREYGHQASERAHEMRGRAAESARTLASQAREQVSAQASELRRRSESLVDSQKGRAADSVSHLGGAIRSAASRLRDEDNATVAGYAESVADQLDGVAGYLRDRDLMGLFQDAQAFARRRPELVLGGMFLAGLAVARFVKAASDTPSFDRMGHNAGDDDRFAQSDEYGSYSGYRDSQAMQASPDAGYGSRPRSSGQPLAGGLDHVDTGDIPTQPYSESTYNGADTSMSDRA